MDTKYIYFVAGIVVGMYVLPTVMGTVYRLTSSEK